MDACFLNSTMKNSQLIASLKTHAYFYLIREREFAIRGEDVYKLGITAQSMELNVPRFKGYKKGSELIMITECPMAMLEHIEKTIKDLFCKRFVKHDDGHEYFLGNHRQMANLIYKACDDAWTDEQQQIKKDILRSVLQLSQADHKLEPVEKEATPQKRTNDDVQNISSNSKQLALAETTAKADFEILYSKISTEELEKAEGKTTRNDTGIVNAQAEALAEEASRIAQEDEHFKQWFEHRLEFKVDSFVKQIVWYPNYRSWAAQAGVIPLPEAAAVATFKRLYASKGISVGSKTYGIKLISAIGTVTNGPESQPSNIVKWLHSVAQSGGTAGEWVSGSSLYQNFEKWLLSKELKNYISSTKFGVDIKKHAGVYFTRSNGSKYCLDPAELLADIESCLPSSALN